MYHCNRNIGTMNKITEYLIGLAVLSVMCGCAHDRGGAMEPDEDGDVTVRLTLRMGAPEAGAPTRTDGSDHVENRITDAAVLLFTPSATSTCDAFATTPDKLSLIHI